jgi:hypothetical protein
MRPSVNAIGTKWMSGKIARPSRHQKMESEDYSARSTPDSAVRSDKMLLRYLRTMTTGVALWVSTLTVSLAAVYAG